MYVLHAHWRPSNRRSSGEEPQLTALLSWAETSAAPPPRARQRAHKKAQTHPFAAAVQPLATQLQRWWQAHTCRWRWQAKPPSSCCCPRTRAARCLPRPCCTSGTCPADPLSALHLLQSLPGDAELPPALRIGDDMRFWQAASHFVLALLAQQKLLPTLVQTGERDGALAGRWRPVVDGPRDAPRLVQLARAMPPLCRAQSTVGPDGPADSQQPAALLGSFLEEMTDALARQWGCAAVRPALQAGAVQE